MRDVDSSSPLGDVVPGRPERLLLLVAESINAVNDDLLGDIEFVSDLAGAGCPPRDALQVVNADQELGYFETDLPFNCRRLASVVAVSDVESFVCEEASSFHECEFRVYPDLLAVSGRDDVRMWSIPNYSYWREGAQHAPYILHDSNIWFVKPLTKYDRGET